MKKLTSLFLLTALLLQLTACGSTGTSQTTSDDSSSTDETTTKETDYIDTLTEKTFDGETLQVIVQHQSSHPNVPPEEQNGERVDDALYNRDRTVEDKLGITIEYTVYEDRGKLKTDLQNAISAGEAAYDVVITSMADGLNTLAPEGYLIDLESMPSLSLDAAWWSNSCHNNLSFYGKQYITSGPISLDYYYAPCVIAFNQKLIDEHQIENPYDMVLDGKWTIDKFGEITKDVSQDLNGDGKMDKDDLYAFACDELTGQAFYIGCGGTQTETGNNGEPVLTMNTARNTDILDKIISVVNKKDERLLTEGLTMEGSNIPAFNKTYHFKNG